MRKSKLLAAALAGLFIISLAGGCGSNAQTEKESSGAPSVSEMAEGTTSEKGSSTEEAPSASTSEPSSAESEPESEAASTPSESKPESTKPAESKPSSTKPVESGTTASQPVAAKPTENSSTAPPVTVKPPESKPEETKPIETQPPESQPVETPAQTQPPETPSIQPVQIADSKDVEAKVAQYINEYRNTNATVLPGLTQVARYRSKQLVTNFAHSTKDEREALAYYQYGEIVDMTILGLPSSENYYRGYNAEAIAKGDWGGTAEQIARNIADGFKKSEGHWSYLGSDEYAYIAVGCTYDSSTKFWYCCVCVSENNFG